ncbi:MAG: hypothetical protein GY940_41410 [bacterium]|nr:hypothetical protein [bacterium]
MEYDIPVAEKNIRNTEKNIRDMERLEKEWEGVKQSALNLERRRENLKQFEALDEVMPDVRELLEHMAKDPKLRHRLLLDFYDYKDRKGSSKAKDENKETAHRS